MVSLGIVPFWSQKMGLRYPHNERENLNTGPTSALEFRTWLCYTDTVWLFPFFIAFSGRMRRGAPVKAEGPAHRGGAGQFRVHDAVGAGPVKECRRAGSVRNRGRRSLPAGYLRRSPWPRNSAAGRAPGPPVAAWTRPPLRGRACQAHCFMPPEYPQFATFPAVPGSGRSTAPRESRSAARLQSRCRSGHIRRTSLRRCG